MENETKEKSKLLQLAKDFGAGAVYGSRFYASIVNENLAGDYRDSRAFDAGSDAVVYGGGLATVLATFTQL